MNRRGFLRGLGLAVAAVAVAPAMKFLIEKKTVCTGLLAQIRADGTTIEYYSNPTIEDFDELVLTLDNNYGEEEYITFSSHQFIKTVYQYI